MSIAIFILGSHHSTTLEYCNGNALDLKRTNYTIAKSPAHRHIFLKGQSVLKYEPANLMHVSAHWTL